MIYFFNDVLFFFKIYFELEKYKKNITIPP